MPKSKLLGYNPKLKELSRSLRKNMTESEKLLWTRIRKKQILGIQFYRQKPIKNFIVDFYAPRVKLVIEIDGSQHLEENYRKKDQERDYQLNKVGIEVLRFNSREVIKNIEDVLEIIFEITKKRLEHGSRSIKSP